jgi:hypothetical protein
MRRLTLVRQAARLGDLVEGELSALVARVEPLGAQVHGVRAVRQRRAHGVERAGRREKLGDGEARHNC